MLWLLQTKVVVSKARGKMKSWYSSPAMKKCEAVLCNWMALWYFVFPLAVYLNPSKGGTANIFYLGVLLPWVLLLLMGRINLWQKNYIYLTTVLLFFYLWMNSFWADTNTLKEIAYFFKWFIYVICLLTAPLLITERHPNFFNMLLLFVFCAAVVGAIATIFFHVEARGVNFPKARMGGWGFGHNPIGLGLHYGIAVLIGLFLVDRYKSKAIWFGLASLLPLSALMLSHSRGPILGLLLCGPLALFLFERSKVVIVAKVVLLGFIIAAAVYIGWDNLLNRGLSGRPEIWSDVFELVKQSVIWGEGYSLQSSRILYHGVSLNHSHNVVLEIMRYGGLVGVLLFVWHLVTLCRFQLKSGDDLTGYYIIMMCFTLLVMMTNGWYLLDRPNYYWLGYWYPVGVLMVKQKALTDSEVLV
jgi:O-Antigen ligase